MVKQFSINNTSLPIVTSYPDLGITITMICLLLLTSTVLFRRLTSVQNITHRCFVSRNVDLLVRAFITYVRPLLEYNSLCNMVPSLEIWYRTYWESAEAFYEQIAWLSLSLIWRTLETAQYYSSDYNIACFTSTYSGAISGLVRVNRDDFFTLRSCSTRGHPYKNFKYFCNSSVRSNFFTERVINLWNNLPIDRVDFSSLPCFKRSIGPKTHTSPFSHSLTPSYLIFAVCVFRTLYALSTVWCLIYSC